MWYVLFIPTCIGKVAPHKTMDHHSCQQCGKDYGTAIQALYCCTWATVRQCILCHQFRYREMIDVWGRCTICTYDPLAGFIPCRFCGNWMRDRDICYRCQTVSLQKVMGLAKARRRLLVCWAGRGKDPLPVDMVRVILTYLRNYRGYG